MQTAYIMSQAQLEPMTEMDICIEYYLYFLLNHFLSIGLWKWKSGDFNKNFK